MATSNTLLEKRDTTHLVAQVHTSRDIIHTKDEAVKKPNPNTPFVLDCCKVTTKLPKYNCVKDRYLEAYFGKKSMRKRIGRLRNIYQVEGSKSKLDTSKDTSFTYRKYALPFHQKQLIRLSKKLEKSNTINTSLAIKSNLALPSIAQSKEHIDHLIKEFDSKSKPDQKYDIKIFVSQDVANMKISSNKPKQLKPISKEELVNTIAKIKKQYENKLG